jgi:hypothetical protein
MPVYLLSESFRSIIALKILDRVVVNHVFLYGRKIKAVYRVGRPASTNGYFSRKRRADKRRMPQLYTSQSLNGRHSRFYAELFLWISEDASWIRVFNVRTN